jgi:hypothetical protein
MYYEQDIPGLKPKNLWALVCACIDTEWESCSTCEGTTAWNIRIGSFKVTEMRSAT